MEQRKAAVCAAVDARQDAIFALGEDILRHPELGYREARTSGLVRREFERIGLEGLSFPALTGVKGWLRGHSRSACIAVLGELDAVLSPAHPFADPQTGAAHACGHNAQIAAMLGCAEGLRLSGVMDALDGDVCFLACPAEEFVEIEERRDLAAKGEISWLGGKQELIAQGALDEIDLAMLVHSETDAPHPRAVVGGAASGFLGKTVRFQGKEAHAGGAPWMGVNALNAASLAIQAIHCQRETFRDEDRVRVHPILTKGGNIVNTIPADVRMESYVRAANIDAMRNANEKVDRAIQGAAYAVGATAEINTLPGYLPLVPNAALGELFAANARELMGAAFVEIGLPFCGSTDMGDLGWLLPVIQPTVSGFSGAAHSKDFCIADPELAYLVPAKLLAMTIVDLLSDGAAAALAIRAAFPRRTKEEYERFWAGVLA